MERVGLGCQLMKRSGVDVGRLLIAHCCKKFASQVIEHGDREMPL